MLLSDEQIQLLMIRYAAWRKEVESRLEEEVNRRSAVSKEMQDLIEGAGVLKGGILNAEQLCRSVSIQRKVHNLSPIFIPKLVGNLNFNKYLKGFQGTEEDFKKEHPELQGPGKSGLGYPGVNLEKFSDTLRRLLASKGDDFAKAMVEIRKFDGVGLAVSSGYLYLWNPGEFPLVNGAATEGFESICKISSEQEKEAIVEAQRLLNIKTTEISRTKDYLVWFAIFHELKARHIMNNFHELDWFLWGTFSKKEPTVRKFWQIAPGENARLWDDLRNNSIAAVGYDEFNFDVTNKSKDELIDLFKKHYPNATDQSSSVQITQLLYFLSLKPGDKFVSNRGRSLLLGLGIIKGPYKFRPERKEYRHTIEVEYYKVSDTGVPIPENLKGKFGRTIVPLTQDEFEPLERLFEESEDQPSPDCPFSVRTFELLAELHENPTLAFYQKHGDEFKKHLEEPFQQLLQEVATLLPAAITDLMETEKGVFARIIKNDFGKGGAWDYYWGAFYPKGGQRIKDVQLYLWMNRDRLEFGFCIGEYGLDQRNRFLRNCQKHHGVLVDILRDSLADEKFRFGRHEEFIGQVNDSNTAMSEITWEEWLKNPAETGIDVVRFLGKREVLKSSAEQLKTMIVKNFGQLFPLVLLATSEDPLQAIGKYLNVTEEAPPPPIPLPDFNNFQISGELYFERPKEIEQIIKIALKRKHIILTGPPGTGKTKLAKNICEKIMGDKNYILTTATADWTTFDTIGGYMPKPGSSGTLEFRRGKFLDCLKDNNGQNTNKWLIIDEINRADIDKAFGQLFSVLSGIKVELPFKDLESNQSLEIIPSSDKEGPHPTRYYVPDSWRLIGTMNTYDKASLYEMSFAFMRRFAFVHIDTPDLMEPSIMNMYAKAWGLELKEPLGTAVFEVWKEFNDKSKRKIGPAIIEDIVRYSLESEGTDGLTAAFNLYVLPQLEGMRDAEIIDILNVNAIKNHIDTEKTKKIAADMFKLNLAKK